MPQNPDISGLDQRLEDYQLASVGDRVFGMLLDVPVGFGILFYVGMKVASRYGGGTSSGFKLSGGPALLTIVIVSLIFLVYSIATELLVGATLGKIAAGTRVHASDGGAISLRASVIRNLFRFIDAIFLAGVVAIIATRRNQRFGDLAAGTIVTRWEWPRAVRISAFVGSLAIAVVGVLGGFHGTPTATTAVETMPTLSQFRPKASGAIKEVSLCSSDNEQFQPDRVATDFPSDTHEVLVWYRWESGQGTKVDIRWRSAGSVLVAQNETLSDPSGRSAWAFKTASGRPFPRGDYEVDLLENGKSVTVIPFHIGGTAPK